MPIYNIILSQQLASKYRIITAEGNGEKYRLCFEMSISAFTGLLTILNPKRQ
jgi:hypothetical protein